jgi:hypothetical protein
LIAAAVLALAQPVLAATGSDEDPIPIHFKRGSDTVELTGELKQNVRCCAYRFEAHAGQMLRWRFVGPAFRAVIVYPNGDADGPGIPYVIRLPMDGTYILTFSPNLMADGAFGRYRLTLTIPPARRDP